MIKKKRGLALAVAVAAGLLIPTIASATDGYFDYGYGTKNKGVGGAGVAATGEDAMAAATNPAAMVYAGNRYDLGYAMFAPVRGYSWTNSGAGFGGQARSDNDFFVVPHMAMNYMLDSTKAVGVTVYGNGGMNTSYAGGVFPPTGGGNGSLGPAGVDLLQLFIAMTYSQKITTNSSVGVSVIPVLQEFEAYGLQSFATPAISSDPNGVTNNGYSTSDGIGFKLGWQGQIVPGLRLGVAYQPKIHMSKFKKYDGLFADQGGFDIPSNYTVGAAWNFSKGWNLLADYERINYSDVPSVSNASFTPIGSPLKLGDSNGPGFGWRSINVFKLGANYTSGTWTWRLGYNHCQDPVQSAGNLELLFNILAPGVVTDHYTVGFTKTMSPNSEIDVSYAYAPKNTLSGVVPATAKNFGGGDVSLYMYQNVLEFNFGIKF